MVKVFTFWDRRRGGGGGGKGGEWTRVVKENMETATAKAERNNESTRRPA